MTAFAHRRELFQIAERWFCDRPDPTDPLRLTEIFICDAFIIGETLGATAEELLKTIHPGPSHRERIQYKGELRDTICRCSSASTPRMRDLFKLYQSNPDFYYREVPINGFMFLDDNGQLLGLYRVKRPRRIAEKAKRKIAAWIFHVVQDRAQMMAEERAAAQGIPLNSLITPESEMIEEFVAAETLIARSFSDGCMHLDQAAMMIHDVGGIKIIADENNLLDLESAIKCDSQIRVLEKQYFNGQFRANSFILEVEWDPESICRKFYETESWRKCRNRGISEERLKRGLEPLLYGAEPKIEIELILSTIPDMVESELGNSIHEAMIIAQRDSRDYKGHIPTNVEFLLEYLFAVGFSPQTQIDRLPIKLWGRYLPDTLISHIRSLYKLPQSDLLY